MANQLTMADIQAILSLHETGWRNRRIARELNIDRETVAKYVRASACVPKPAKAPIGSAMAGEQAAAGPGGSLPALASNEEKGIVAGSSSFFLGAAAGNSKPAKAPLGSETLSDPLDPVQASVETAERGGISAGVIGGDARSISRFATQPLGSHGSFLIIRSSTRTAYMDLSFDAARSAMVHGRFSDFTAL
jgi:hypothetical protein